MNVATSTLQVILSKRGGHMAYLYLLIGIVGLILAFIGRGSWDFVLAVILGIIFVIFGLYEIFMPRK